MTKNLMIVESPTKIRSLAKYLGKDFEFEASMGHICDLPTRKDAVDPEKDFATTYEIKSQDVAKKIKKAAKDADVIYLATDPDREGEAISWHINNLISKDLKPSQKVYRITFHSITKDSVINAVSNPRELNMDLVNAQQARRIQDYLVGFTLSPILWSKIPSVKSAGRVQSVTLRMICDREAEIEKFDPQEFWDIEVKIGGLDEKNPAHLSMLDGQKLEKLSLSSEAKAQDAKNKISQAKDFYVSNLVEKNQNMQAYPPFTTSSLQQDASHKLGYSPTKTMMIAQQLYEAGKINYMRTDSVVLDSGFVKQVRNYIEDKYGKDYLPSSPRIYSSKAKNIQEAHEAIRVIDSKMSPDQFKGKLSEEQWKLYDLIWRRTISCQMSPAVTAKTSLDFVDASKQIKLHANGSVLIFDGFSRVYPVSFEQKKLPKFEEGQKFQYEQIDPAQHYTRPPARYNEASLIRTLEEKGIGRPSTYAPILNLLKSRDYCYQEGKQLIPNSQGWVAVLFLKEFFPEIMEYKFTAQMEEELDEIAEGKDWKSSVKEFWKKFSNNAKDVKGLKTSVVLDKLNEIAPLTFFPTNEEGKQIKICPKCNSGLSLKVSSRGTFIGCSSYPECSFSHTIGGEESEKVLYVHPDGGEVSIKMGKYGPYLNWDRGEEPAKRVSIKGVKGSMTKELAEMLLGLPKVIGEDKEGSPVKLNVNQFGPHINSGSLYVNFPFSELEGITLERALELLEKEKQKITLLGEKDGSPVIMRKGRFSPYLKWKTHKAFLAKNAEAPSLEEALELLEQASKAKPSKAVKKKKATKTVSTKTKKKKDQ